MNIPETIIDAIKQKEIKELGLDGSEIILDSLLDEGTLKDIPVLGSIFKLYSVSKNISNNIFSRKLLNFMHELGKISDSERIEFVKRLDQNKEFKNKVGEKLLFILDKLDDGEKATYLARAFKLYLTQIISYKEFLVLAHIIDRINIAYLPELSVCFSYFIGSLEREIFDHFLYCGILKSNGIESDYIIESNPRLYKSKMGKVFADKIIEKSDEEILSNFIECILNIEIIDSIGDYEEGVTKLNSRGLAKEFLKNLDRSHYESSFISGKQFLDKDRKTRFRRTGIEDYEFFTVKIRE